MSATRLLVLGVVRIMQPVHGYDVRSELLSWRVEQWSNVKPGSIYSALKTLEKDGLIAVTSRESRGGRPERTEYVLTGEGEKEFQIMLRETWWQVAQPMEPLLPGLCLMWSLSREELLAAVQSRVNWLTGQVEQHTFKRSMIKDGATGADGGIPEHVREVIDFGLSRVKSELDWSRTFLRRLRSGAYTFAGEAGALDLGAGRGARHGGECAEPNED